MNQGFCLFSAGRSWSRQTGILVLLGTVCMIFFLIMTSVICEWIKQKTIATKQWHGLQRV